MADIPAAACESASATMKRQRRTSWPDATTRALIRLWEDNLAALRSNMRNARIYARILQELNAGLPHGEGPYNAKQLRLKMDNLGKRYRKERLLCTRTGSSTSKWPYYGLLHNFLGSLPMNDDLLVEENVEIPEVTEPPEGAELLASWEDHGNEENVVPDDNAATTNETPEETSLPCTDTSGDASKSSAPHDDSGGTRKARKRPLTTAQLLLESHKEEIDHIKKSEKKRQKLMKKLVKLQGEANDINASMCRMMERYFESKDTEK
ncbi:uncharacterized protein LOC119388280 [Rhipicephalus sanguineus]|uniref:uncharacterized protein LOC119388280 n=1 Tax=Rhipicephalus sanguineus TaxID=34632 RepID=UPI001893780F|nr:uncharacterized protein LOC119388280 [Rhipicephalus sanguineus]